MSPKLGRNATLLKDKKTLTPRHHFGKSVRRRSVFNSNARRARVAWGALSKYALATLKSLSETYSLEVAAGELQFLDNRWYVTHAGLLQIALRQRCLGIRSALQERLCDPAANRWVFKATVYTSPGSKGFVGYGDADPSNVSPLVRGAEMRVAETRAVNRALRKAYGIGLCSVEELAWGPRRPDSRNPDGSSTAGTNGHSNSQPRLRDRLCLLIRQHQLDAALVKAYAADYCGTPTLREATRESVEAFINALAERATRDRDGLLCHLNSYAKPTDVSQ
jgi:hypothetical protein